MHGALNIIEKITKASPNDHFTGISCSDTSAKSMTWQGIEEEREDHVSSRRNESGTVTES